MNKRTTRAFLRCSECNGVFILYRKTQKQKKAGHIKHLWCFKCKKVTQHIETKGHENTRFG